MEWLNQYGGAISVAILSIIATILMLRNTNSQKNYERQDSAWVELKGEIATLKSQKLVLEDYAYDLRDHIEKTIGPPPPDWPEAYRKA